MAKVSGRETPRLGHAPMHHLLLLNNEDIYKDQLSARCL